MNKLFFMIFVAFAVLSFACDDKDKEQTNTPVCEPACNAVTDECVCKTVDGKELCACEAKAVDDPCKDKAELDTCGDNKVCTKDGETLVCKDKPVTEVACDHVCNAETEECVVGDDGKNVCRAKEVKPTPTCDPACEGDTECKCSEPDADGKVTCTCEAKEVKPVNPCSDKSENDECGENKTCQKVDDVLECKDKPVVEEPTQPIPVE